MAKDDITDDVEGALPPSLPAAIKEKITQAVWSVLDDNISDEELEEM